MKKRSEDTGHLGLLVMEPKDNTEKQDKEREKVRRRSGKLVKNLTI